MSTTLTATVEVTLPPPATQPLPHAGRVVTILGSHGDGKQTVAVNAGPIVVKADHTGQVTIEVQEQLANGNLSPAGLCVLKFEPHTLVDAAHPLVQAVPADPKGFGLKLVSLEPATAPAAPANAPAAAAVTAPSQPPAAQTHPAPPASPAPASPAPAAAHIPPRQPNQ